MDILKQIQPKSLKDVVGNRIQISHFLGVLKNENPPQKIVLLIGPDGCGKTLISELAIQKIGFNVLYVHKEITNAKDLTILITRFVCNKTITSFFDQKRKLVFLENIDIMLNTDKTVVTTLSNIYDVLEKHNVCMLVTCKSNEERKILELKNKVEPIKINYPSIKDAFVYLSNVNSQLELDMNDDDMLSLVNKYKGSIRDVIMNMYVKDNEYDSLYAFKDMTQFEIVKRVFRKYHPISEMMSLLKYDVSMVSYLMYENVPDELQTNFDLKASKISFVDVYARINDLYMVSSEIEDFMYVNTDWSLYDIVHLIKVHGINIVLHSLKQKATQKDVKYRFSQAISKISHKNIMNKKVKGMNQVNGNISVMESIALADIISKDTNIRTSGSRKQKMYDMDECNFINTYQKYFE